MEAERVEMDIKVKAKLVKRDREEVEQA